MKDETTKTMTRKDEVIIRRVARSRDWTSNMWEMERLLWAHGVSGYDQSDLARIACEEHIRASGHIDFALTLNEIKCCVVCDKAPQDGRWHTDETVTLGGEHSIRGLVGICSRCEDLIRKRELLAKWRKTAPSFIRIVAKAPVLLVVRGQCDDKALAPAIRETLDRVPMRSRNTIMEYVCTKHLFATTGKGLRFEALGRWPGMGPGRLRAAFSGRTGPAAEMVDEMSV